jgi:nitroreductase
MPEQLSEAFEQIVRQRRSVRGFTPQRVPRETLERIFTIAGRAPSNCNTQPWDSYVVSGETIENLRERLPQALLAGEYSMDFEYSGKYDGAYKERQYDAAAQLYSAMDIARADREARTAAFARNFEFFGAPHAVFLFLREDFGMREAADLGMYAQTLMLGFTAFGLASCPQTALSFNADLVREVLGVEPSHKLLFGISFGYEDLQEPANNCRVERASLEQTTHFLD